MSVPVLCWSGDIIPRNPNTHGPIFEKGGSLFDTTQKWAVLSLSSTYWSGQNVGQESCLAISQRGVFRVWVTYNDIQCLQNCAATAKTKRKFTQRG